MHPRPDRACIATFPDAYTFVYILQLWANDIEHRVHQCHSVVEKSFFSSISHQHQRVNLVFVNATCLTLSIMSCVATRTAVVAAFVIISRKRPIDVTEFRWKRHCGEEGLKSPQDNLKTEQPLRHRSKQKVTMSAPTFAADRRLYLCVCLISVRL